MKPRLTWSQYGQSLGECLDALRNVRRHLATGEPSMGVQPLGEAHRAFGQSLFMSRWAPGDWDRLHRFSRERLRHVLLAVTLRFQNAIAEFSIPRCVLCPDLCPPNDRIKWRGAYVHALCQFQREQRRRDRKRHLEPVS